MNNKKIWRLIYTWIILPFMFLFLYILSFKQKKIRDSLNGRKGLWERWDEQIKERDIYQPLIWFHSVSAGEFLQAQPVLERCLKKGWDCAITVSSINGYKWAKRIKFSTDKKPLLLDYLPLDFPPNIERCLAMLQPSAIVYSKFDLWPNLVWIANDRGISQFLISGTLQPQSLRVTTKIGRSFYRELYACLNYIITVAEEESERFRLTNPDHPNIHTGGDTRFDSVMDRKRNIPAPKLPSFIEGKFVFILGSSWPPDEKCVFPALKEALDKFSDFFLIVAPHEPTEEHLDNTESYFKDVNLKRLSNMDDSDETQRILLVDKIGVLSSLYSIGNLAFVGGAFTTGVHNTMEPCAMGLPVIFGPIHYNSPEAVEMLKQKIAFTVESSKDFQKILFQLLEDRDKCRKLGEKALNYIENQCGAVDKCFQFLLKEVS